MPDETGENMVNTIDIVIDGKQCSIPKAPQSVADILAVASLSPDQFTLVSQDGTKHHDPTQSINICSGDCFSTVKRDQDLRSDLKEISYRVNGESQTTPKATITVEAILCAAGKDASIDPTQVDSYILEDINNGRRYENLSDTVDISDGDEFLAVHSGATPVAFLRSYDTNRFNLH